MNVEDLEVSEELEVLTSDELTIVSCQLPKEEVEEEPEEDLELEEGEEPEESEDKSDSNEENSKES